ncbi:MAG: hypothetical protein MAG431_01147 [Chloroflexi bacterium]|nr:hypothetical protein [Chloroflexota bacterium]
MTPTYKSLTRNWIILITIILITVGGLAWGNYRFATQNPGGNDFLVHWVGARALIFEGRSPYSDTVATQIQTIAYGHPAQAGEHDLRVAYPLYSELLFAPFALVENYAIARAAWMTLLEIALVTMTFLSLSLAQWRPNKWILTLCLLFTLIWYHAVRALINGNAVIIIGLLLTGAFVAIREKKDEVAGFLLAYTTIKPQLVVLIIPFILYWAIHQRRWKLVSWFLGSMAALVLGAMIFIPNWIIQNIWEIMRYPDYNPAGTLGQVLASWMPGIVLQLKWGITITLSLLLLWEWWSARQQSFTRFLWTACLTLVISQWIGIQTDPGNFIYLFPALILILAGFDKRWQKNGIWVILAILSVLFVGLWLLFILTLEQTYQPTQDPIMFIPLPAFLLIGLYWVKWWIVHPARLALEG